MDEDQTMCVSRLCRKGCVETKHLLACFNRKIFIAIKTSYVHVPYWYTHIHTAVIRMTVQ